MLVEEKAVQIVGAGRVKVKMAWVSRGSRDTTRS